MRQEPDDVQGRAPQFREVRRDAGKTRLGGSVETREGGTGEEKMTCIVGVEGGKSVWIGGDSAQTDTYCDQVVGAEPKVFVKGKLIFGCTGSLRMKQVLRSCLEVPNHPRSMSDEAWLCGPLVDSIREMYRRSGFMRTKDGSEEADGTALVGYLGRLYVMQADFALIRSNRGWETAGSGGKYAAGAMVALSILQHDRVDSRIRVALRAAEACNASVCGPFTILRV
jgi:ATP-dependent protease HslVU (ClpYQ) peptidase subunit